MASEIEIRNTRIAKIELLKKAGFEAYPSKVPRDMCLKDARLVFDEYVKANKTISLTGRVTAIRGQGAIYFVVLDDGKGTFQFVFKKDSLDAQAFSLFVDTVDIGDFLSITGTCFTTQRGEPSVLVSSWLMASKSLLPMPEKWHGIQDEDIRLRKRYLDLATDPELRDLFIKRSKFWDVTRTFLKKYICACFDTSPRLYIYHPCKFCAVLLLHVMHMSITWDKYLTITEKTFNGFSSVCNNPSYAWHLLSCKRIEVEY
jgi:lysyl-tRNA synthetase class 2